MNTRMNDSFEKIIPTAWLVAFRRTFSDIPFSKEIFTELDTLRKTHFLEITDELLEPKFSPQFEARHKIIDRLILTQSANQILEIAAGFSGRGMTMSENSSIKYVEFDLPDVIKDKKIIAKRYSKRTEQKTVPIFFSRKEMY
jgi:O-methyltransferase involved in polyketide biosynthesis